MIPAEHIPVVLGFLILYWTSSTACMLLVGFLVGAHYGKTLDLDLPKLYEERVVPKSKTLVDRMGLKSIYSMMGEDDGASEDEDKTD